MRPSRPGTPLQTRAALCRTAKNCYYADRPPLVPPTRRRRLLLPTLYASRRDALAQQGPPPPQHYRQRVRAAAARRNEETMPPVQAPGGNFITHFIASWMENSDATEKRMIDHTLRLHAGCLRMRQSWTEAQHTPAGWKPQLRKEAAALRGAFLGRCRQPRRRIARARSAVHRLHTRRVHLAAREIACAVPKETTEERKGSTSGLGDDQYDRLPRGWQPNVIARTSPPETQEGRGYQPRNSLW